MHDSRLDAHRIVVLFWHCPRRFAGVTDALCIWRCVEFFVHDPQILVSTSGRWALPWHTHLGGARLMDATAYSRRKRQGSVLASMASSFWAASCCGTMALRPAWPGCWQVLTLFRQCADLMNHYMLFHEGKAGCDKQGRRLGWGRGERAHCWQFCRRCSACSGCCPCTASALRCHASGARHGLPLCTFMTCAMPPLRRSFPLAHACQ